MNKEELNKLIDFIELRITMRKVDKSNLSYEETQLIKLCKTCSDLLKENKELKKRYYKFYKYENNPNGTDYCFCQRPCESNMSLHCFLENGEILGFMSETLVSNHPEIKEIDLNEFMYFFVRPLIKENKELKEQLEKKYEKVGTLTTEILYEENKELNNKIDKISNFIKENKIKRYRPIEGEEYDEEILLDVDDISCLERIINDEYDYENR